MITVTIDSSGVSDLVSRLEQFATPEGQGDLLRYLAISMLPVVHDRIHVEGKDARGGQIGNYSPEYMKVRTGQYSTNRTITKGKNKGQTATKGIYTKGEKKGQPRPNYNRDASTKVIISLTRQLENDESVIADGNRYGIGFKNVENYKKSQYVEATYKKKIFALTPDETELTFKLAKKYITDALQ